MARVTLVTVNVIGRCRRRNAIRETPSEKRLLVAGDLGVLAGQRPRDRSRRWDADLAPEQHPRREQELPPAGRQSTPPPPLACGGAVWSAQRL